MCCHPCKKLPQFNFGECLELFSTLKGANLFDSIKAIFDILIQETLYILIQTLKSLCHLQVNGLELSHYEWGVLLATNSIFLGENYYI
jgi:hypothetical protein